MTAALTDRERYLRARALERARCDEALASGFVIEPEHAERAANEILVRSFVPFRKPRLTESIIEVTPERAAELAHLEPVDRWAAVAV